MKKTHFNLTLFVIIFALSGFGARSFAQTESRDYDKLKKDYDAVLADRNNLLLQSKNLGEYKNKFDIAEAAAKKIQEEKARLEQQIQVLNSQLADLNQKISDLEAAKGQAVKENEDSKKSLEKMTFEYKIVAETKKDLAATKTQNVSLARNAKQLELRLKKLEEEKLNNDAQQEIYRMQIKEHKKRYEQALERNRLLEKKAEQMPARFAEISRQNKTLLKETALMHYNLGVFYSKNREYTRALAEFDKAVELNPDDASSYFNLGYICAEYLVNRPKAITYFRKFLSLVKTEDKDVDWVKKYILTWQTWEGKKPME
jgi:tetratricopeptide (TPR) repeat protein